jgi:hypothetical protein
MSVRAVITSGEDFIPLPFSQWATEARVEQDLSKAARFAIRFSDDLCEGKFDVAGRAEIKANTPIGIFARVEDQLECLVYGPITKVRTSSMLGGSGSWVEIHGEDQRLIMGRVGVEATWTGLASEAAEAILDAHKFEKEVEATMIVYDEKERKLSQRATDLAFLEDIARRNNFEFWLDYEVVQIAGIDAITVIPHAKIKSSPPRGGLPLMVDAPTLVPDGKHVINVHPPPDQCVKVTRFDVKIDYERPNAAYGFAQPIDDKEPVENVGEDKLEPVTPDATAIAKVDGVERKPIDDPQTDPAEQLLAQQAALTEAAWFVEIDCSTTLDLIHYLVRPHMIVDVQNATPGLTGAYQVKSALHVINAADHLIDFKLRANGLPPEEDK